MTRTFLPWIMRNPRHLRTFTLFNRVLNETRKLRDENKRAGLIVPPFIILSITQKCNLKCVGCYAVANGNINNPSVQQLSKEQWCSVFKQARELGVLGFVIAGGEPFMFPGLIDLCLEFKDRFFIIVTNGTYISDEDFTKLKKSRNICVVVSLEGDKKDTDLRRGEGVHDKATNTINRLIKAGILTGISATITKLNYEYWMQENSIDSLTKMGVKIAIFLEYVPNEATSSNVIGSTCQDSTKFLSKIGAESSGCGLALTRDNQEAFRSRILRFRKNKSIYIIHSPGDEEYFGGCVSSGRGFVHITPTGNLTPCPVSNLSTHNLATSKLKEGLGGPLFKMLRESGILNSGHSTACALAAHSEEAKIITEIAKLASLDSDERGVGSSKYNDFRHKLEINCLGGRLLKKARARLRHPRR